MTSAEVIDLVGILSVTAWSSTRWQPIRRGKRCATFSRRRSAGV